MKNLVIGVSAESSLNLLAQYADIVTLDKDKIDYKVVAYDTVYIRSHFTEPSLMPDYFKKEIDTLVQSAKNMNPKVRFIDRMDTVDAIMAFEDKWHQYETFGSFMPRTEIYDGGVNIASYIRPVYKQRLSSNGSGVTWNREKAVPSNKEWIIQESLDIQEELRIYILFGEVYPVGAVRKNMSEGSKAQAVDSRNLFEDEIKFSTSVIDMSNNLDIVGIDVARNVDGQLCLIEVNRSPGFAKFKELTGINLASVLYEKLRLKMMLSREDYIT